MLNLNLNSDSLGGISVLRGGVEGVAEIQGKPQPESGEGVYSPGGGREHATPVLAGVRKT